MAMAMTQATPQPLAHHELSGDANDAEANDDGFGPNLRHKISTEVHVDNDQISILVAPDSLSTSIFGPVLAVVLQAMVAVTLAIFSTVDAFFGKGEGGEYLNGALLTSTHALYLTGTTVMASLISIYTTGQIRRLWVTKKYGTLYRDQEVPALLRRQLAVLLGLGSVQPQVLDWNLTVSLALAGLLTTAIVSRLAPSATSGTF